MIPVMCNKCKLIRVKFESMLNKKKNKCLFVCIVRTSIFSAKYRDTPSFQLHLSPHFSLHRLQRSIQSLLSNMASMLILQIVYCLSRIVDTKERQVVTNDTPPEHSCQSHNIRSEKSWTQTMYQSEVSRHCQHKTLTFMVQRFQRRPLIMLLQLKT